MYSFEYKKIEDTAMKIIVNYNPTWDNDGYYITQNVRLECTEIELAYINSRVHEYVKNTTNEHWLFTKICEGRQRLKLTMLCGLKDVVGKDNKRLKNDRNTFLDVIITQRRKMKRDGECATCKHPSIDMKYCTLHGVEIYQDSMSCNEWEKAKVEC